MMQSASQHCYQNLKSIPNGMKHPNMSKKVKLSTDRRQMQATQSFLRWQQGATETERRKGKILAVYDDEHSCAIENTVSMKSTQRKSDKNEVKAKDKEKTSRKQKSNQNQNAMQSARTWTPVRCFLHANLVGCLAGT